MEKAIGAVFLDSLIHLRCFLHMKDNIRRKLTELLLPQSVREDIIRDIFDVQQGSTYTQGIEMMKVLLIDNLNLKTCRRFDWMFQSSSGRDEDEGSHLRRTGASNRNIGKISFQVQVVYQENLHHFMSTEATEKPKSLLRGFLM